MNEDMKTAIKKARSEYQREWRKRNPEKTKEYINRYWEKRVLREQQNKGGNKHDDY